MHTPVFLRKAAQYLVTLRREFSYDQCPLRAAALAFASLLALVPVSALLFSLFSGFGAFRSIVESIQEFLIRVLIPTRQEEILAYITRFVENTRGLGVIGLVFFLITSVLLLAGIQRTFDAVWGSTPRKTAVTRVATYLSALIVGSFLLSMGLNVVGVVRSSVTQLFSADLEWFQNVFIRVLPGIFLFAALFFMIRFIPAGRVVTTSAFLGAVVGAILWEIARVIFVFWVSYVLRLSVIYGSLAVIPIFLIWIYLAWTIVLVSLEVAYIHQHRENLPAGKSLWEREPADILSSGLGVYLTVAGKFAAGADPPSSAYLANRIGITERDLLKLIEKFREANLLIVVGEKKRGYVPSRDLSAIQTEEVARCIFGTVPHTDSKRLPERLYETIVQGAFQSIRGSSIRDVINSEGFILPEPAHQDETEGRRTTTQEIRNWFRRLFNR